MTYQQKTLANSGRPVAYVASFRSSPASVEIGFTAFPSARTEVEPNADLEAEARTLLNEELSRLIAERLPVPSPTGRARRSGNPEVFEQMIVPDQSIAMKALLWDQMRTRGMTNSDLARRLQVDEKEVRRLLDPASTHRRRLAEAVEAVIGVPVAITVVDGSRPARIMRAPGEGRPAPVMNLVTALAAPASIEGDVEGAV